MPGQRSPMLRDRDRAGSWQRPLSGCVPCGTCRGKGSLRGFHHGQRPPSWFCGLSATHCGTGTAGAFRLGALPALVRRTSGQSGGGRAIRGSSFRFPFGSPPGARQEGSVVVGTQRAFSSRRTGADRRVSVYALAARKPGAGHSRWGSHPRAAGFGFARVFPGAGPVSLFSPEIAS